MSSDETLSNSRTRRSLFWTTAGLLLLVGIFVPGWISPPNTNNFSSGTRSISRVSDEDAASAQPIQNNEEDNAESESEYPRRRLQHRTMDPVSRANVLAASAMAMDNARAQGKHVYQDVGDPFQRMHAGLMKQQLQQQGRNSPPLKKEDISSSNTGSAPPKKEEDSDTPIDKIRKATKWDRVVDPLAIKMVDLEAEALAKSLPYLDYKPSSSSQLEYLGVTVDAARGFFPLPWWKRLIVYLAKMHYNLIHLRLTDDEMFAVQLESYPELATSGSHYTTKQVKELVAFAKAHNITLIPEIQLPLRAAAWVGVPGLIMNCPNFYCDTGHYAPLNLEHPPLPTMLEEIIQEILGLFNHPPMLHLGGSLSLHEADECFHEATIKQTKVLTAHDYWMKWERMIKNVLKKVGYPEANVIRMQPIVEDNKSNVKDDESEVELPVPRVGGIEHYWMTLPGNNINDPAGWTPLPGSVVSTGLDFTVDDDDSAWTIYSQTQQILDLPTKPRAIIVGTLFLNTHTYPKQNLWLQRNVLARLVAVAMGAAEPRNLLVEKDFEQAYQTACQSMLPGELCELQGHTVSSTQSFMDLMGERSREWRHAICSRLTVDTEELVFQPTMPDRSLATSLGNQVFWKYFHRPAKLYPPRGKKGSQWQENSVKPVKLLKHKVDKAGVILDLANSLAQADIVRLLFENFIAPLGLDWLQLRLTDDFAFATKLDTHYKVAQSMWEVEDPTIIIPKLWHFKALIDSAYEWNVEVIPEISLSTNAGGWINGGFLVQCPEKFCKDGTGIPNNIQDPQFLALAYSVLRELRETFGGSSSYLHLGADERVENLKCFEEDGLKDDEDPPFGEFEAKLKKILIMLGVKPELVIRYDNDEQLTYDDRVGGITHYRATPEGDMPDIRAGEPFLTTVGLLDGTVFSVYKRTRALVGLKPQGILGEIQSLDQPTWKEQHVGLRLIALKLGLSIWEEEADGHEALDKEEFVKEVIDICRAVKFPHYINDPKCEAAEELLKSQKEKKAGDDDAMDNAPEVFPVATSKFREAMCHKHTRHRKTKKLKEQFSLVKKK